MKKFKVADVPLPAVFDGTVYLDRDFVVAAPETVFTEGTARALEEWGFTHVFSDGEPGPLPQAAGEKAPGDGQIPVSEAAKAEKPRASGGAETFLASFGKYAASVFAGISSGKAPVFGTLAGDFRNVCDFAAKNRQPLVIALWNDAARGNEGNAPGAHAARTALFAVLTGIWLELPAPRLRELAVAALLHEVGTARLPASGKDGGKIPEGEAAKNIRAHPVLGGTYLKGLMFPAPVFEGVAGYRERENGEGYPRRLIGRSIHPNAKIIAVSCAYDEAIAGRRFEDGGEAESAALFLKNGKKRFDGTVMRAFASVLAVYRQGTPVLMSDGRKGVVVGTNADDPRYPSVLASGGTGTAAPERSSPSFSVVRLAGARGAEI